MEISSMTDPMVYVEAANQMKNAKEMQSFDMAVLKQATEIAEMTMGSLLGSIDSYMQGLGQYVDMRV